MCVCVCVCVCVCMLPERGGVSVPNMRVGWRGLMCQEIK